MILKSSFIKTFSDQDYQCLNMLIGNALAKPELAEQLIKTYDKTICEEYKISAEAWAIIEEQKPESLSALIHFIAQEQNIL